MWLDLGCGSMDGYSVVNYLDGVAIQDGDLINFHVSFPDTVNHIPTSKHNQDMTQNKILE